MPNNPLLDYAAETVSFGTLAAGIAIAILLSLILRWHYLTFSHVFANRAQLANILPLIATTTLLVITIIKSSLALSLGLVGAMSIVRFRTPIKEPEELAYLFLAIGIGLGTGSGQFLPTVMVVTVILIFMYVLKRYSSYRNAEDYDLFIEVDRSPDEKSDAIDRILSAVADIAPSVNLAKLDQSESHQMIGLTITVNNQSDLGVLFDRIRSIYPNARCTFIDHKAVSL